MLCLFVDGQQPLLGIEFNRRDSLAVTIHIPRENTALIKMCGLHAPGLLLFRTPPPITVASLELELLPSPSQCCCRTIVSDRRIHLNAMIVTEDLTNKVVAWATQIASYAAQLPSKQARDDYLRERRCS
jgi:hypothetical protein